MEIRPQKGQQEKFLSTRADIAIYGGAAFGGKTWALLVDPLRHVHNPKFGGVIFRRTSPQITNEGALWDESVKIYPLAGATGYVGSLDWRFPSGASIGFSHLQHESTKQHWQGSSICYLGFDELTHFSYGQFFYLISRNRSGCGVRPYVRCGTNPDAASWVKEFLAQWVDVDHPDPAADGEIRWFIRDGGTIRWAHTRAELVERFPGLDPKSVTFVRAWIWDNKVGMALDPGYLGNLQALPVVERARLLDGDWAMRREGLVYPGLFACGVEPEECPLAQPDLGGIDYGFSNPFAALSGVLDCEDVLWITGERYKAGETISQHALHLPRYVRWWADPAGADQTAELRRAGHEVTPCVHLGRSPLLTGIDQVTDRIRSGRLKVSKACINLLRESGLYAYDPMKLKEEPIDADNHALSALRYLVVGLDRGRVVTPLGADPAVVAAQIAETKGAAERVESEHRSIDNPMWWGGSDDG